jgi:hypothetical protein
MFQPISQLANNAVEYWSFALSGIKAVDIDRKLVIKGTRGRAKYAPKWTIWKMSEVQPKALDYDAGRVQFRAWSIEEAVQRVNSDTRLINRINTTFGEDNHE